MNNITKIASLGILAAALMGVNSWANGFMFDAQGLLQTGYRGSTVAAIAAATVGPTVLKGSPGRLEVFLITTAGSSGTETFYDNATSCSGRVIGIANGTTAQATAIAGYVQELGILSINGITACGGTGSPALTIGYY